jgi:serine/threonine-protein kinase HipA
MNRKAKVYNKGILAGILEENEDGYQFAYDNAYFINPDCKAVTMTLPKTAKHYFSRQLFPFFFGLLAEGTTMKLQCRILKIDENDHFGRLLKTAHGDIIGSITIEEIVS